MAVHRQLGPGYKKAIYQEKLEQQLTKDGIGFEQKKNLPVYYNEQLLGVYIPDFIIENQVIRGIKAFTTLHNKYLGQVITYLNHRALPIGLLRNLGDRRLLSRRVFLSPQATEFRDKHQWIFVHERLQAQKRSQEETPF